MKFCTSQLLVIFIKTLFLNLLQLPISLPYFQVKQPRGDYRELLELVNIFLSGAVAGGGYSFKKPGALSKTRWMARAIYALKTWMFGRQLKLSKHDDSKLFELCVFTCRAYVCVWFRAPLANQAPRNDILFLQLLYKNKDLGTHRRAALEKFSSHLWYLSPRLAVLALFDEEVSLEQKRKIVSALKKRNGKSDAPIRAKVVLNDSVLHLEVANFISKQSMKFFHATDISTNFLEKDPVVWGTDESFQEGLKIVTHFHVVNDAAERAVALVTRFLKGNKLTNDEGQRQLLLVTVAEDRKSNKLVWMYTFALTCNYNL